MKDLEQKLKKETEKIRMRVSERTELRERLLSYMEYHPLSEDSAPLSRAKRASRLSPYAEQYFFVPFSSWYVRGAVGAFALLLLAGIPVSAEHTVPGDVLYAMKVHVNEEVRSELTFSTYDKVTWQAERVLRRIAEARELAKEGKLTPEAEAQITATVKVHAATARQEIVDLRKTNADEAAVAEVVVASALEVQSAVLDTEVSVNAQSSSTESGNQIRDLALAVKDAKDAFAAATPDQVPSASSYERFNAEVEESTTRARDLYASLSTSVTAEEGVEIKRRLEDIDRKITVTHSLYAASSTGPAIDDMKEILGDTQKVIAFMTDIDVRKSVALEELVPKQLTLEERKELVQVARGEIAESASIAVARASSSSDVALRAKIKRGLEEVKGNLRTIDNGLAEGGSIGSAESAEVAATAMVHDLLLMTESLATPENIPTTTPDGTDASTTPLSTASSSASAGEVAVSQGSNAESPE